MLDNDKRMNDLYRDLFSNSPKEVCLDIPSDIGVGRIVQTTTKQGAVLTGLYGLRMEQ